MRLNNLLDGPYGFLTFVGKLCSKKNKNTLVGLESEALVDSQHEQPQITAKSEKKAAIPARSGK